MAGKKSELLVADDDATIRRLLAYHGERAGFEVVTAEDGVMAMELVSERTEVLVLDLRMPGTVSYTHLTLPTILLV